MNMQGKDWEGRVIDGRFPLVQYLGGGERSAVFVTGREDQGPKKAAIKLIFTNAPRAMGTELSHPHLLRLFETGRCELDGTELAYLVMEYADENLAQVLTGRPLSAPETRAALESILDVLEYLHEQGLVHGRVRPANILAVGDQLKLSSDGLCRAGAWEGRPGEPGACDPPELALGWITPAADVWSLGITLVEALTQHPPARNSSGELEPLLPARLPVELSEIVFHSLEPDPRRRWTLRQIRDRLAGPTVAPGAQTVARPGQTRLKGLGVGLGLALAVAVVVAVAVLESPHPAPPSPQAVEAPQNSGQGPQGGAVRHQVLPEVSSEARNSIRGTVRVGVKVRVNPSGTVVEARLASPGPSKYFARVAREAALHWEFDPPRDAQGAVASEWLLEFVFDREATQVRPEPVAP
jgi:TonB family protein